MPVAVVRRRPAWRRALALLLCVPLAGYVLVCATEPADASATELASLQAQIQRLLQSADWRCQCVMPDMTPEQLAELERRLAEKEARLQPLRSP